jgi:translation initiation factor 1A
MGKNIKGGKHFKKQKKDSSRERELVYCEEGQSYARVIKQLGDGRFECQIFNTEKDTTIVGKICGSMRKRVWVNIGNIVLVSVRSFDSSSCDIIHKYTDEEAKNLKNYGEIPENINLMATNLELASGNLDSIENDGFTFENV